MAPVITVYDALGHTMKQIVLLDELHPESPAKNRISESSSCYRIREEGIYEVESSTFYNAQGYPLSRLQKPWFPDWTPYWKARRFSLTYTDNKVSSGWSTPLLQANPVQSNTNLKHYSHRCRRRRIYNKPNRLRQHPFLTTAFLYHHGYYSEKTDGRGNTTITETDLAQRPVKVTDAAGNVTRTSYHPCCDAPACITDALGGVTCYSYDIRGRKTAEYGDAIRPSCFAYDDSDHLIALTTFRANEENITTDPSNRTDGDTTTWMYDVATGMELKNVC